MMIMIVMNNLISLPVEDKWFKYVLKNGGFPDFPQHRAAKIKKMYKTIKKQNKAVRGLKIALKLRFKKSDK